MMQILTKDQAIAAEKEMDDFLLNLDFNSKANIVRLLEPFEKEMRLIKNFKGISRPDKNVQAPKYQYITEGFDRDECEELNKKL